MRRSARMIVPEGHLLHEGHLLQMGSDVHGNLVSCVMDEPTFGRVGKRKYVKHACMPVVMPLVRDFP
jgi:hypothetical protein